MKKFTRLLVFIVFSSQSFAVTVQEKYDWFFTMTPKKYHEKLAQEIERLEKIEASYKNNFRGYVKNVSEADRSLIRMFGEYVKIKESDPTVMQDNNVRVRSRMGQFLLSHIIAEQENMLSAIVGEDFYTAVSFRASYTGKEERKGRYEVCPNKYNPNCLQTIYKYDPLLMFFNDDRVELVALYKIHLMPAIKETLFVLQKLLEGMQTNPILNSLIFNIKVYTALKEQKDDHGGLLGMIVIYPVSGQENVQILMNELVDIFKEFKGTGHQPRDNMRMNDLIWYAQSGGDDKMWLQKNKRDLATIFDESTNYALYRPDFEKIEDPEKFEKPYVPHKDAKPEDNPYALKVSVKK